MTVYVYTGTPGSGKSCHVAREIRENLNRRYPRPIIANFELAEDAPVPEESRRFYHYVPNDSLRMEDLIEFACRFWDAQGGRLREDYLSVYIDECQLLFNARNWNAKDRLGWLEFLSQSRKYGYRIVLIAQNAKMIDNQFRMLIEIEVNHRRISQCGVFGWVLALPFRGRLMMTVRSMFQLNERLGMRMVLVSKRDWRMYDSYKRFEPDSKGGELRLAYSAEQYESA